ncbi:NAD-dependent 4,6-dehydratase LegB [Dechloromonas denitrificans]|uniref:NAD-dependent 4,6-dehydratase LegB n=1 Tax=Dechloromonas denitrificans TaxID=281362 RepID=UPI00299F233A|nr:NAD-dependent 4,6-dehydratase LegB [Dechloromonas denitrificans]
MSKIHKVLVTGADGFIGSHLVEELVKAGYSVRALCQYNSFSSWGWLDESPCRNEVEVVLGDVRDPAQMHSIAKGIDTIFHLAALIAIPYSYQAPSSYVDTNIQGTLNVLQAALDAGVGRIIHTSTSEVYGTARFVPINEEHPLQAQSPYSATKIGADALAFSFFSSFGLPVTIARPFNTYGPRQSARAVIPTVITQILTGKKKIKLGSLAPTRDFNFVLDTCAGFLALAGCDAAVGKTVNIGSGSEISVGDTVRLIARLIGMDVDIECDDQRLRPAASEVERLCCDNKLIRELTGFLPAYDLEQGLRKTIEWLQLPENLKRYKADVFNV